MSKTGTKPQNGKQRHELLPPTNPEAEKGLLASLFARPDFIDRPKVVAIQPADFFDPAYQVVLRHLVGAHLDGQSPQVLPSRITAAGEWSEAVRAAVIELAASTVSGSDADYYADEIRETAELRKLWQLQGELARRVRDRLPAIDTRGFLEGAIDGDFQAGERRLSFITSAELAKTDQNVPYIVDSVLPELQNTVFGGPSKSMKTSGLIDFLISISTGGHGLGYFQVLKQRRCWLISGESGQNVIAETAARIAKKAGHELPKVDMLWGFKLPRLANAADVRELGRVIKAERIGVLGVDPLYLSIDTEGKETSMYGMGGVLRPVAEMCQDHGCTLILAHHFRQSIRDFAVPQLSDLSHAGIEQFARAWILYKRREAYKPGSGEHRLHLVTGGSAGHGGSFHLDINEGTRASGRFWDATVTPSTQAEATAAELKAAATAERELRRREENRQKILTALRQSPKGETKTGLKDAVKLKTAELTELMDELIREGKVELCEVKKHTTTHDGYRIVNPQKERCPVLPGTAR